MGSYSPLANTSCILAPAGACALLQPTQLAPACAFYCRGDGGAAGRLAHSPAALTCARLDAPSIHPCTGTYVGTTGATATKQCAPGSYASDAGKERCDLCAAGSFAPGSGSKICQACPAGTRSDAGASKCSDCPAGERDGGAAAAVVVAQPDSAPVPSRVLCSAARAAPHQPHPTCRHLRQIGLQGLHPLSAWSERWGGSGAAAGLPLTSL